MEFRTIMVSLALDHSNKACLAVAGDLAERTGARVIGIAASDVRSPMFFAEGEFAEELFAKEKALVQKKLNELEVVFREFMKGRAEHLEWRFSLQMPTNYVLNEIRAADVIVTGRSSEMTDAYMLADPEDLVMQAGRPLIVVPDDAEWLDMRSVLVAWKDTRESRRAVCDALPLLSLAKDVTVVEVMEGENAHSDASARVKDVTGWLSRHGIQADGTVADSDEPVAAQLDAIASDVGASVVVAGAYGHSRFREFVLGGVTRHLLAQSGRCSFLSR